MAPPVAGGGGGSARKFPFRRLFLIALVPALLLIAGCAKSPSSGTSGVGPQLNISLTVHGQIDPSLYYYVVFNNVNNSNATGPVPVIAPPWGNGFVAGAATSYMSFHGNQGVDGYQFYNFQPGTSLQTSLQAGTPTQDTPITSGASTIQFRIPLSYLATTRVPASAITSIQVNFITTNYVPVNPQDTTPKEFDALGDPSKNQLNSYITIPTTQSATFINPSVGSPNYEPQGDVSVTNGSGGYSPVSNQTDPTAESLDIIGYSIQVLD